MNLSDIPPQLTEPPSQAMIADLRADSSRWRQEQRATGTRGSHSPVVYEMSGITVPDLKAEPYVGSRTYENSSAARSQRNNADSPSLDGPYGPPSTSRSSGRGQVDAMQIDTPPVASDRSRYGQPSQPTRGGYQPENPTFPTGGRDRYADTTRPPYQQDQPMMDAYGRVPVSQPYGQDPRHAGNFSQSNDGAPPGYVRQGDYYVPITSGFSQPSVMAPSRPDNQPFPSGPYGQAPEPQRDPRGGRDSRDTRDPRYGQDYNEASRYYPSPATTAASVGSREPIASPPAPRFALDQLR
jgi:hypothetical protein